MWRQILLITLASATGAARADTVSFKEDVVPILNRHCVMCHLPGAEQGGLSLYPDAWTQLVDIPSAQSPLMQVKPGSPEDSYLYVKLIDSGASVGGSGQQMPGQQPALDKDQIETIRLWIEQGAQNN